MSSERGEVPEPYPELLAVPAVLDWTRDTLASYGFHEHTSLPLVSVCRDELMFDFVDAVAARWGHCFDLSSLAGLPLMGRTGLGAALGHAPDDDGRHRLVVFAFPHIGADGGLGAVRRPGPSTSWRCCCRVCPRRSSRSTGRWSRASSCTATTRTACRWRRPRWRSTGSSRTWACRTGPSARPPSDRGRGGCGPGECGR